MGCFDDPSYDYTRTRPYLTEAEYDQLSWQFDSQVIGNEKIRQRLFALSKRRAAWPKWWLRLWRALMGLLRKR